MRLIIVDISMSIEQMSTDKNQEIHIKQKLDYSTLELFWNRNLGENIFVEEFLNPHKYTPLYSRRHRYRRVGNSTLSAEILLYWGKKIVQFFWWIRAGERAYRKFSASYRGAMICLRVDVAMKIVEGLYLDLVWGFFTSRRPLNTLSTLKWQIGSSSLIKMKIQSCIDVCLWALNLWNRFHVAPIRSICCGKLLLLNWFVTIVKNSWEKYKSLRMKNHNTSCLYSFSVRTLKRHTLKLIVHILEGFYIRGIFYVKHCEERTFNILLNLPSTISCIFDL